MFTEASSGGAPDALKPSAASESCGCAIMALRIGALAGTAGTAGSPLGATEGAVGAMDAVWTFAEEGTAALPIGALAGGAG